VGVAVYNTFRSNKKVSGNQGNASNNTGTNTNMTESAANKESAGIRNFLTTMNLPTAKKILLIILILIIKNLLIN